MTYAVKPLAGDPQKLKGLPEKLIVSHYENNCGGASTPLTQATRAIT